VNPAIKKALCRDAYEDRACLHKVQPWLGHDWHFHVRIGCQADSPECEPLRAAGDGCHSKAMERWANVVLPEHAAPHAGPAMSKLPKACWDVLKAP
jgi:penicillin-insensitive murein DD-endopeptidase